MMKDTSSELSVQLHKATKSNIANKGLTAAGASLLASEIILGDGVDGGGTYNSTMSIARMATLRGGPAGTGDGSDQSVNKIQGKAATLLLLQEISCVSL